MSIITITKEVYVEDYVDVDIEDYVDVDIDVDVDDIIGDISDKDLVDEVIFRDLEIKKDDEQLENEELRRHICDILNVGYHIFTIDELLTMLKKKILN